MRNVHRFIWICTCLLFVQLSAQMELDQYNGLSESDKTAVENGEPYPGHVQNNDIDMDSYMPIRTTCQPDSVECIIPVDFDTWERIPFTNGSICSQGDNGYTSDDCSSDFVEFAFTYDACGETYNGCWVNTNGNLTFDNPLSQFTPDGIPNNTAVMVAPFWADVDLGQCGEVWVTNTETHFIATWIEVGYYGENCDLLNTFQVVLTNGNDPLLGIGQNTAFYYCNIDWTTGDASSGTGGFGGEPATVGINTIDGDYALIGRFDHDGSDYDGPEGDNDGDDFLDNKFYLFDASNCSIESSCSIFDLEVNAQECENSLYDLTIEFTPAGVGAIGFFITVGEEDYGPYPYGVSGETTSVTIPDFVGTGEEGIEILVFDLEDFFCATDCSFDAPLCAEPCEPEAGTMPTEEQIVCDGGTVAATTTGEVLEEGDILLYILHTNSGAEAGTIINTNTTGSFEQGSALANTTYYISAVVGDDTGKGEVNYNDPCTVVAPGTPVVFMAPVEITFSEFCDVTTGEFTLTISVSGGMGEYMSNGSYTLTGTLINDLTVTANESVSVAFGSSVDGLEYTYSAIDNGGCSGSAEDIINCVKLAIELVSFNGSAMENGNLISWSTGAEIDNDYFILERSYNGNDFEMINQQNGAGNSNTLLEYSFLDVDVDGDAFYQLKQVDLNGEITSSGIIYVDRNNDQLLLDVAPNPFSDVLVVAPGFADFEYVLQDLSGQVVDRGVIKSNNTIETQQLNSGVYFIEVKTQSTIWSKKLIKL